MSKEIDDRLDDLADLTAIWAELRKEGKPTSMAKEFILMSCRELCGGKESRVPRAWVKGQPYDD
jgi:hypothetical protein